MAKLIEERELNPAKESHLPLNGLEVRTYIVMRFKQWLDGRHDLFNIARVYAESDCHISMALVTKDEQPATDSIEFNFDNALEIRSLLTGTPVAKSDESGSDAEIKPQGKRPVKIHRGYAGSKVEHDAPMPEVPPQDPAGEVE